MDYCKSCGSEVATGTDHCPSCGDVIDEFASAKAGAGDEALHREIQELAQRDGVLAAVKRYRVATGCDLKTSKDAVERLVAGGIPAPIHSQPPDRSLEQQVLELAQSASKIAAIKHYREATGCGLKDSKEAVESLLKSHGVQPRAGSGCAGVLVLLLTAAWGLWLRF